MIDELEAEVAAFLELLARDIEARPWTIQPLDAERVAYALKLVEGVEVDLDAALDPQGLVISPHATCRFASIWLSASTTASKVRRVEAWRAL